MGLFGNEHGRVSCEVRESGHGDLAASASRAISLSCVPGALGDDRSERLSGAFACRRMVNVVICRSPQKRVRHCRTGWRRESTLGLAHAVLTKGGAR